jgi:hypothetical protein
MSDMNVDTPVLPESIRFNLTDGAETTFPLDLLEDHVEVLIAPPNIIDCPTSVERGPPNQPLSKPVEYPSGLPR